MSDKNLVHAKEVVPRRRRESGSSAGKMSKQFYAAHLSETEILSGLSNGTIYVGTLKVFAQKRKIAYVCVPEISVDIVLLDERARNRAHPGDKVYVEIMPQSQWSTKLPEDIDNTTEGNSKGGVLVESISAVEGSPLNSCPQLWNVNNCALQDDHAVISPVSVQETHPMSQLAAACGMQPCGHVVGIHTSCHRTSIVGALKVQDVVENGKPLSLSAAVFFSPMDKKIADLIVDRAELPDSFKLDPFKMQKIIYLADISPFWGRSSKCASGINVRSIGEMGNIHSEVEALLTEYNIDHLPFDDATLLTGVVESITEPEQWVIPPDEFLIRRDLRSLRIFSIDPYSARDLDDALHITELSHGIFEVGVHIADVSYFVREGTALDAEARQRATSVYLVHKVIPMLPRILCEHLCSLNPNVDRLAYSCIWKMREDGTLIDEPAWFGKSIIRSCAKLDYATAQRMVDGLIPFEPAIGGGERSISNDIWEFSRRPVGADKPIELREIGCIREHSNWEVCADVKLLHRVAMNRRELRTSHGALSLNRSKLTFQLDSDGNPIDVGTYIIRDTNKVVEEYMLLTNYLVAQELVLKGRRTAFLRRHEAPSVTNKGLSDLRNASEVLGVTIDISSASALQRSLNMVNELPFSDAKLVVESLLMKIMQTAEYFTVGNSESLSWHHFALGIPYYTHFTSPIRRYADLIVHRQLSAALGLSDHDNKCGPLESQNLSIIADHCNSRKKTARDAETRCDTIFLSVYLMRNPVLEDAVVIGIGRKSFTVMVNRFGFEHRLFVDNMPGISYSFDADRTALILERKDSGVECRSSTGVPRLGDDDNNKESIEFRSNVFQFDRAEITILSRVRVYMSTSNGSPISVNINLHSVVSGLFSQKKIEYC